MLFDAAPSPPDVRLGGGSAVAVVAKCQGTRLAREAEAHGARTWSFRVVHGLRPSGPPVAGGCVNVHAMLLSLRRKSCWLKKHTQEGSAVTSLVPPLTRRSHRTSSLAHGSLV